MLRRRMGYVLGYDCRGLLRDTADLTFLRGLLVFLSSIPTLSEREICVKRRILVVKPWKWWVSIDET